MGDGTVACPVAVKSRRTWWIVAAGLNVAVLTFLLLFRAAPRSQQANVTRFPVYPAQNSAFASPTYATVGQPQFALSPDGRALAFVAAEPGAKPLIWLRDFDEVVAHPLPGTENGEYPFWSPDSGSVAFFAESKLKKIRASGGPVQVIAEEIGDSRGGSWAPDGTILFGNSSKSIYRVPSGGGMQAAVTTLDASAKEASHRYPQFLPDSQHFLFTVRTETADRRGIYAGSLDGSPKRLLIHTDSDARYVPPGVLLFLDGNTLLGQRFDPKHLKLLGQSFPVAEPVGHSTTGYGGFSASGAGTVAYSRPDVETGRLTWFDRSGAAMGSIGQEGDYTDLRLSPDDKQVATSLVDPRTGNPDIWLTDLARGSTSRFTAGPALNNAPAWSPDGSRLVFRTTRRGGAVEFFEKSSGGAGKEGIVLPTDLQLGHPYNISPPDWSPDGRSLLYLSQALPDLPNFGCCTSESPNQSSWPLWLPMRCTRVFLPTDALSPTLRMSRACWTSTFSHFRYRTGNGKFLPVAGMNPAGAVTAANSIIFPRTGG